MAKLTCTAVLDFDHDVDLTTLSAYLASCLLGAQARAVEVEPNRVKFRGGVFRLVSNWNVLVAFGWGEITIHSDSRQIRYVLSFRQLAVVVTVLVGLMGTFLIEDRQWQLLVVIPFAWLWLFGANVAIGLPRFRDFMRRALEGAPRRS